jgi:hypothetical protein
MTESGSMESGAMRFGSKFVDMIVSAEIRVVNCKAKMPGVRLEY